MHHWNLFKKPFPIELTWRQTGMDWQSDKAFLLFFTWGFNKKVFSVRSQHTSQTGRPALSIKQNYLVSTIRLLCLSQSALFRSLNSWLSFLFAIHVHGWAACVCACVIRGDIYSTCMCVRSGGGECVCLSMKVNTKSFRYK